MTLPTSYTWYLKGESYRMHVPYEAPQGRRVNAIGAYFTHGPMAGEFLHRSYVSLPSSANSASKPKRKTLEQTALEQGLAPEEVGPIDALRFLEFVWMIAGGPTTSSPTAPRGWKRERPLVIVVDNYSVHHSQTVKNALPELEAADVYLFYLPSYSPQLSRIEPVWHDTKQHYLPTRSFDQVVRLKESVGDALSRKARDLKSAQTIPKQSQPQNAGFLPLAA